MAGSKVNIWKQDPTVTSIGVRTSYVHTKIEKGPKDQDIEIKGMPTVLPNSKGDFLFNPKENPSEFDSVHTFTVVRQVLTMYRRALKRLSPSTTLNWQWGAGVPISVYPRAGEDPNAYYAREEKSLRFFYFYPKNNHLNPLVYTCRSFDIVAHETGHAVLDALRPGYWNSWHPETGGLHESFGDLTSIFTMLAQMDQCEAIIAESKADLHTKSFFSALAEQFGEALGRTTGLRNADNNLKMSDVSTEVHDLSQVFTGAVYDIIADIFADHHDPSLYDPAESLFRVGSHIASLLITAITTGPAQNATYSDIAKIMLNLETNPKWQAFIGKQFSTREVLNAPIGLAPLTPKTLCWDKCCGTLRHPNQINSFEKALKTQLNPATSYTAEA